MLQAPRSLYSNVISFIHKRKEMCNHFLSSAFFSVPCICFSNRFFVYFVLLTFNRAMPFRNSASDITDRNQSNGKEAWNNEPIQNGKYTKTEVAEMEQETAAPTASVVVPLDGGWGWVVVAASFCCNTIVDGIVMSAGMFQQPIREEFGASVSEVIFSYSSFLHLPFLFNLI